MTHLSVNLNKIALLRNSRGKDFPSPKVFGKKALELGAHGLTVHPRPDERHARFSDLPSLKDLVLLEKSRRLEVEFNIEGYPSTDFLEKVISVGPDQCTLVPDPPEAITSNAGWDFEKHQDFLTEVTGQLQSAGIRVSLFLDPFTFSQLQLNALSAIGPERIELYTEKYALAFGGESEDLIIQVYKDVSDQVGKLGIDINAGHDLNQKNLGRLIQEIPMIKEVSIGHALIVESLWDGFSKTIKNYLNIL